MFLGVTAQVRNWNSEGSEFTIALEENPLTDFVELPTEYKDLWYSNILCGVIRGALEMVCLLINCFVQRSNFVPSSLLGFVGANEGRVQANPVYTKGRRLHRDQSLL